MCVWVSLKTRRQRTPIGNAKDGVSHPRWATRLVETAEAGRLDMYLRSVWYIQPNSYLGSVVGGVGADV